jgi:hypothetical protein
MDFTDFSITITVVPNEFNRLTTKEWRQKNCGAYGACFGMMLSGLGEVLCSNDEEEMVSMFIEDGHTNSGGALEVIRKYKETSDDPEVPTVKLQNLPLKIGAYGVVSKKLAPPLWASDLLAYGVNRMASSRDQYILDLLTKITNRVDSIHLHMDSAQIEHMKEVFKSTEDTIALRQENSHKIVKLLHKFGGRAERVKGGVALHTEGMTDEQKIAFLNDLDGVSHA